MYRQFGAPKNLLEGESHLRKEPQTTNVTFCPKTFTMAEDPKANTVGENEKKELKELRDKCKEVMGNPPQNPFGNERDLFQKTRKIKEITKLARSS